MIEKRIKKHFMWGSMVTILGMGISFGIGFGIVSFLQSQVDPAEADAPEVFWGSIFALFIATAIAGSITKSYKTVWLIFFLVGIPCSILALNLGLEWYEVRNAYGFLFELCSFTPLYPLLLAMPFAALGGVVGYKLSAKRKPLVTEAEGYKHEFGGGEQETAGEQKEKGRYEKEEGKEFRTRSRIDDTYYEILGVKPNSTRDEIRRAYRKKMKEYHPDKFMDQPEWVRKEADEMSKKLNEAYEALMKEG